MKKFFIIALAAVATLTANAQLLWKVTGKDAKDSSYLFGTHHLAPVSVIDSIKPLVPAIRSVDAVAGEVDMADMGDPTKLQPIMMSYVMAPADSTLTAVLTEAQADSVNTVLGKYTKGTMLEPAMIVEALAPMKPAIITMTLSTFQSMAAFPELNQGGDINLTDNQLDAEVQKRARECQREIIPLETIESQLGILLGGSIKEQVENLMETVRNDGEAQDAARKLVAAYRTGDLDAIYKLMAEDGMDEAELDKLLYKRNDEWIEKLTEIIPAKSVLVCVGAGHLVGSKGLINRLRELGYTVEPAE